MLFFFLGQGLILPKNEQDSSPANNVKSRNDRRAGLLWLEENVSGAVNHQTSFVSWSIDRIRVERAHHSTHTGHRGRSGML